MWGVRSIAVSGSTVYFGGIFGNVGGQVRHNLAAVDSTTGSPTGWNPNATNAAVNALIATNTTVYVGGRFPSGIGGVAGIKHVAALDATTGNALWTVTVTNTNFQVGALALAGNTLYVGGRFTNVAVAIRNSLAALDATTGAVLPWNPGANGATFSGAAIVSALAVSGNTVYVGGDIGFAGGQPQLNPVALDATSGNALAGFRAAVARAVFTVAVSGNLLYAGCVSGGGDSIGGEKRNGLAALSASTGAATGWNPSSNSAVMINTLAVSNNTIYVGGSFTNIGGQARKSIAAIDANTGAIGSWNPNPFVPGPSPPQIKHLLLSGNLLYVGGSFTNIGGQVRRNLAAVMTSDASATTWDANAGAGIVNALALHGSTIYAGGSFSSIGGQSRSNLAALDIGTANASGWNPNPNSTVNAIAVRSDAVYVGGQFSTVGSANRNGLVALDSSSGLATVWTPNAFPGAVVQGLALASNSLFVAGNIANIGRSNRSGRAELDLALALATAWNPTNFVSNFGVSSGQGQVLALGATNIYTGGQFPGYFAAYSLLAAPPPPAPQLTMPVWDGTYFSFRLLGLNDVSHVIEVSPDLQSWSDIDIVIPAGGFFDFTDPEPSFYEPRFYRARVGP